MANNAKCIILGNLIKDPLQNTWNNSTVVSFTVSVNTGKKDGDKYISDLYNVSVWGKTGEFIFPRLQKGTLVQVCGDLSMTEYEDKKTGQKRQSLSMRATEVTPLARQKEAPQRNTEYPGVDPF